MPADVLVTGARHGGLTEDMRSTSYSIPTVPRARNRLEESVESRKASRLSKSRTCRGLESLVSDRPELIARFQVLIVPLGIREAHLQQVRESFSAGRHVQRAFLSWAQGERVSVQSCRPRLPAARTRERVPCSSTIGSAQRSTSCFEVSTAFSPIPFTHHGF